MFKKILVLTLGLLLLLPTGVIFADTLSIVARFSHDSRTGGEGTERLKLSAPKSACLVFDGADLKFNKRRYGKAKITASPDKGCNPAKKTCRITVKWEHKPAGSLDYKVQVKWRDASDC